ncbi:MAG: amidohydrolase [Acidimicrobiia bacterium]|nr:MAG: amidohydrolase [Acidimicrobiia bacterium]
MTACISADSHVTEPPGTYVDRIDPRYRDRAPRLAHDPTLGDVMVIDNGQSVVPMWLVAAAGRPAEEVRLDSGRRFEELHRGGWDPRARLADQDVDGVAAEVVYPSVGMLLCNHPDVDYQHACFEAYNRWIAEFCAHSPDRLVGIGQTALRTPEDGIADLESIAALGLRGVMLPGLPPNADYDDPMYDEFWAAVVDLGLPPSFHILTTRTDQILAPHVRGPKLNNFMTIIRSNQDVIGTLVFGGVFERHPRLRVVCVEADAGWAPHYMYRADHAYDRHRNWLTAGPLSRRPSEYFREHVYLTFQDDWVAFRTIDLMNADRLMWANDFPHSDATWPDSQRLLAQHAAHLAEDVRRRVLRDNAAELYRIPSGT